MAYIPIPLSSALGEGTYRLTFSYPFSWVVPNIQTPYVKDIGLGYQLVLSQWVKDDSSNTLTAVITLNKAPSSSPYEPLVKNPQGGYMKMSAGQQEEATVPIQAIITGVVAIFGIGLLFLTLQKVEALVESPTGTIFIWALAAVAFFLIFKALKRK